MRYVRLDAPDNTQSFEGEVQRAVSELAPASIAWTEPGDWRVSRLLREVASSNGIDAVEWPDTHFLTTRDEFAVWVTV